MPKISALPAMTSADGADPAPIVDDSAGSTKKITLTKMKEWLQSLTAWISPAMWTNPYKFSAYCSTGKNVFTTTLIVDLQTELFDTNNNFTNSRYTAPVSGFYLINAAAWWGSAGAGTNEYCTIHLRKNGLATGMPESDRTNGSGTADRLMRPHLHSLIQLTAGDYIELWISTQGSRDLVAGQTTTYMNGHLVTPT